jgi:hypothetical protein
MSWNLLFLRSRSGLLTGGVVTYANGAVSRQLSALSQKEPLLLSSGSSRLID